MAVDTIRRQSEQPFEIRVIVRGLRLERGALLPSANNKNFFRPGLFIVLRRSGAGSRFQGCA